MTKRHSRFVQAMGNGNYLTVAILRLVGFGGIVTVLGAMFWIGSTSADLAANIKANTEAMRAFIYAQEKRDAGQDNRMTRQDQRFSDMLRQLMSKP